MGRSSSGQASKAPGHSAARPLLSGAAWPAAVAIVVVCALVTAAQGVWLRHGMETSRLDLAIDAKVRAMLGGHPLLLAALVGPGEPRTVTAIATVLVLVCVLWRRYRQAALVAISVPLATAVTELVLKPFVGRTPWGNPFPSGHVTSVAALATILVVLLAWVPALLRLVLAATAFLMTAAVAVGVMGANMHHFSDTVGGAAVGIGTVLLTALIIDRLISRAHSRRGAAGQETGPGADPSVPLDGAVVPGQTAQRRSG
jgi:membrane-associated phospholipid phosphatase